jgi:hypothetical protein
VARDEVSETVEGYSITGKKRKEASMYNLTPEMK